MLDLKDYGIIMWEEEKIASFREKLLAWYDAHKRDLPWRRTQDPYKIWISEIMPVSYKHLDVYKRQDYRYICSLSMKHLFQKPYCSPMIKFL